MKWAPFGLGLCGVISAVISGLQPNRPITVVITGDIAGYLSPCGCTSPMMGGITRQATLIRKLGQSSDVVLLANGALGGDNKRQEALKVAALAQTFGALKATAINLAPEDAKRGLGVLQTIQNLSDQRLICGSIDTIPALPIRTTVQSRGMLIGGVSTPPENLARPLNTQAIKPDEAIKRLLSDAADQSVAPVLLLDGDEGDAVLIARKYPALRLIVYRSTSNPPQGLTRIDQTALVTPGEYGKSVVRLSFDGKEFQSYQVVPLDPSYKDDPQVSRFFRSYLKAVDRAGFLNEIPRHPSEPFAGSATCGKCHVKDFLKWEQTKHAGGLATLEVDGHGRDPDCVECHVVGLKSRGGFQSRETTPDLASVGCESCHGPGARHSRSPAVVRMPKVGTAMCVNCHNAERSPGFNSLTKWDLIFHR